MESESSTSSSSSSSSSSWFREWVTVSLGLANTLLFSGILCGWAALQSFLEDDHIYDHLCNSDCTERDNRMMFLYGTGQMFSIFAYACLSFLMDRTGPIFLSFFGGLFETAGLLMLGHLQAPVLSQGGEGVAGVDDVLSQLPFDLFDVAVVLTGIGGSALMVHALKLAFIVPPERFAWVMTLANCMVDGSSVMPAALYQFYRIGESFSRARIFSIYACLCFCLNGLIIWCWWGSPSERLSAKNAEEAREREKEDVEEAKEERSERNEGSKKKLQEQDRKENTEDSEDSRNASEAGEHERIEGGEPREAELEELGAESSSSKPRVASKPRLHGQKLTSQLQSFEFAFAFVLFITQGFSATSYMGFNKNLLKAKGDQDTAFFFTSFSQIFVYLLPSSILFAPLFSMSLAHRGFAFSFTVMLFLGLVWSVATLLPLKAQLVAFIAFTNYRAILYSAYFTFLAHTFGNRTFGSVNAHLSMLAAALAWLIGPSTSASQRWFGSLVGMSVLIILLFVPPSLMTLQLARHLRKYPSGDVCNLARPDRKENFRPVVPDV